jgi:hypothetical protein
MAPEDAETKAAAQFAAANGDFFNLAVFFAALENEYNAGEESEEDDGSEDNASDCGGSEWILRLCALELRVWIGRGWAASWWWNSTCG